MIGATSRTKARKAMDFYLCETLIWLTRPASSHLQPPPPSSRLTLHICKRLHQTYEAVSIRQRVVCELLRCMSRLLAHRAVPAPWTGLISQPLSGDFGHRPPI